MRRAYLVCVFIIQLLLVACSSGDEVVGNLLLGEWEVEGEHVFITFFPDKMTIREGSKVDTVAVLDYAVEGRQVVMTIEGRGKQSILYGQILDGDKVKFGDGTEKDAILHRTGAATSKVGSKDISAATESASNAWCEKMRNTPQGEWTMNDSSKFMGNCY